MLIGYMRISTDNAKKTGGLGVEPRDGRGAVGCLTALQNNRGEL